MLHYTLDIQALVSVESTTIVKVSLHYFIKGEDLLTILDEFNDKIIQVLEDQDATIINIALQESLNGIYP
jgi:N-acetyl-anhydromuramyl-L-alanine amidase AmpD